MPRQRQEAQTGRTRFGGTAKADSRRTQGAHKQSVETRPERNQGGHKADNGGQGLEARPKRSEGGHKADNMADELQGRGQSISRPAIFFKERTPQQTVCAKQR